MSSPRIPYGIAKRIVTAMQIGDVVNVRPQYVVAFHNAANRMGIKLVAVRVRKVGHPMYRMLRVEHNWRSGHAVSRHPNRNATTGRWLKDAA